MILLDIKTDAQQQELKDWVAVSLSLSQSTFSHLEM